jgi:hypothetical protein
VYVYGWLEAADTGFERRPMWQLPQGAFSLARPFGDGWLAVASREDHAADDVVVRQFDAAGELRRSRAVARAPGYSCGEIRVGVPIAGEDGDFWLMSRDGCHLKLSSELERLDPYSLVDHLRARGSYNLDWDERQHVYKLLWVLGGLPLCLLAFAALARWRGRRVAVYLPWGAAAFLISGAVCLYQVFPLLR